MKLRPKAVIRYKALSMVAVGQVPSNGPIGYPHDFTGLFDECFYHLLTRDIAWHVQWYPDVAAARE